jgi:hypothetical protein
MRGRQYQPVPALVAEAGLALAHPQWRSLGPFLSPRLIDRAIRLSDSDKGNRGVGDDIEIAGEPHAPRGPRANHRSGFNAEVDKLAKDVATLQLGVAFVDTVKLEVARNQMIEFQVALLPCVQ